VKIPLIPLAVICFSVGAALAQLPEVQPAPAPRMSVAQTPDDETISAQVKDAISSDPELKDLKFTVATTDAVVTLEGTATSRSQISRALAITRQVPGVKSVVNILTVPT